jgi:hypothetical protein
LDPEENAEDEEVASEGAAGDETWEGMTDVDRTCSKGTLSDEVGVLLLLLLSLMLLLPLVWKMHR